MSVAYYILSCLYFYLPAYFANMAPPVFKKLGILNSLYVPIDFGKTFRGKAILGSHKTWRGLILGTLTGMSVVWLQFFLYKFPFFQKISFLDYNKINILFFGFLISFGAVFGDVFFSFFKRRLNIKPGRRWLPFDQIDYLIGSFLFLTPFFDIFPAIWIVLLFLTFFLHIIVNRIGYRLKISESKW